MPKFLVSLRLNQFLVELKGIITTDYGISFIRLKMLYLDPETPSTESDMELLIKIQNNIIKYAFSSRPKRTLH